MGPTIAHANPSGQLREALSLVYCRVSNLLASLLWISINLLCISALSMEFSRFTPSQVMLSPALTRFVAKTYLVALMRDAEQNFLNAEDTVEKIKVCD